MTVTVENGKVSVVSPFNRTWVTRAKSLGGKWNAGASAWEFPETSEEFVRAALMDIYGEDGRPAEKVTIDIMLDGELEFYERSFTVAGIEFLQRYARDEAVSVKNGAIIVKGGFASSGGSAKHPQIGSLKGDTVIRVTIPKSKLDSVGYEYQEVPVKTINRAELEAEKAALLKRLAEIDELLR